jgi:hypothetical protein
VFARQSLLPPSPSTSAAIPLSMRPPRADPENIHVHRHISRKPVWPIGPAIRRPYNRQFDQTLNRGLLWLWIDNK